MATEDLARAFASTRGVLANVKADQLDDPTPCATWKVRDLLNHIIGGAHWFGDSMNAGESGAPAAKDWTAGDMLADFDAGAKKAVDAFDAPGAQEKIVKLPFGEFPGAVYMSLATNDTFTHGWDLARATGQSTDLDPELATQINEIAQVTLPEAFRGDEPMPFALEKEAPAGASPADKHAAFMGRIV